MPEEVDVFAAVEDVVNWVLSGKSTAFPATIIAPYPIRDKDGKEFDGIVNVQPNYKFKAPGDDTEQTPLAINNVPLIHAGRTKGTITRPPKEYLIGSRVLCVTCEHSITEWRSSGGKTIYPREDRQFDFNDCFAILGLYPETVKWPNPQKPNTFEMLGIEGTKFAIGTQTADLVGLTYQILLLMSAGVDPDTGAFLNLAQITPLLAKLLTIANPVV